MVVMIGGLLGFSGSGKSDHFKDRHGLLMVWVFFWVLMVGYQLVVVVSGVCSATIVEQKERERKNK